MAKGRTVKKLNLLDWDEPRQARRGPLYWISLCIAIIAHGGLLVYLIRLAQLPNGGDQSAYPAVIAVEIAGQNSAPPAPKADREDLKSAAHRDGALVSQTVAPQSETAAAGVFDGFAKDLPEDSAMADLAPAPARVSVPTDWREAVLPEDGGVEAAPAPTATEALAILAETKDLPEDRAVQPMVIEQITVERATAVVLPVKEKTAEPRMADALAQPAPKTVEAAATPAPGPVPAVHDEPAAREAIIAGGRMTALLPEDMGRLPGSALPAPRAQPLVEAPKSAAEARRSVPHATRPALAVPVPARRMASAADLLLNEDETGSNASYAEHEAPAHHYAGRRVVAAYRAKVRAHLAAHKPDGGFGPGTVVVRFTLSRTGKVTTTSIVQSSGKSTLDDSVIDAVRRAAPYPKPPRDMRSSQLRFFVPFRFD